MLFEYEVGPPLSAGIWRPDTHARCAAPTACTNRFDDRDEVRSSGPSCRPGTYSHDAEQLTGAEEGCRPTA